MEVSLERWKSIRSHKAPCAWLAELCPVRGGRQPGGFVHTGLPVSLCRRENLPLSGPVSPHLQSQKGERAFPTEQFCVVAHGRVQEGWGGNVNHEAAHWAQAVETGRGWISGGCADCQGQISRRRRKKSSQEDSRWGEQCRLWACP